MYRKFTLLSLLLLSFTTFFAQNDDGGSFNSYYSDPYANVVPQTPSAANFTQYGNTPVDLSSGLPTISIPIYTLQVDGVSVPITLSYHASGVKVDDLSSTVGLKWALNVGGGIYRTIKDENDFANFGWVRDNGSVSHFDSWVDSNQPSQSYFDNPSNQILFRDYVGTIDKWPDLFNYSFSGNSGNFIFKPDGTILKALKDNLTITPVNIDTPSTVDDFFIAKDQSGNSYHFKTPETSTTTTTTVDHENLSFSQHRDSNIVGWKLDTITSRNGKIISFEYSNSNGNVGAYVYDQDIIPASQRIEYAFGCGTEGCVLGAMLPLDCKTTESRSYRHYTKNSTNLRNISLNSSVTKIESDNIRIDFYYSETPPPGVSFVSGWELKLDRIEITDKINNKSKNFYFKYDVFNGDERLKLTEFYEVGFNNTQKPSYLFSYNDQALPEVGSMSKDYKGYYNGKNNSSLMPRTARSLLQRLDSQYYDALADRYFDEQSLKAGVLTSIEYPTGGKTEFDYEPNAIGENIMEPKLTEKSMNVDNVTTSYVQDGFYYKFNFLSKFDAITPRIDFNVLSSYCPYCDIDCSYPVLEMPVISIHEYNGNPNIPINPAQIGAQIAQTNLCGRSGYLSIPLNGFNDTDHYIVQLRLHEDTYTPGNHPAQDMSVHLQWFEKEKNQNGAVVNQKHYLGGLRINEVIDSENGNPVNHKKYTYKNHFLDYTSEYSSSVRNFIKRSLDNKGVIEFSSELMQQSDHLPQIDGYTYTEIEIEDHAANNGKIVEKYQEKIRFQAVQGGNLVERSVYDNSGKLLQRIENEYNKQEVTEFEFRVPSMMKYPIQFACTFQGVEEKSGYGVDYPTLTYKGYTENLESNISTSIYSAGSTYKCVTTAKDYVYNDDVLVEKETTNTRYTSTYSGSAALVHNATGNPQGELIEVFYEYPKDFISEPTLLTVPDASLVTKKVYNSGDYVLGEFWEFDSGNVKAIYRYNNGLGSQTGAPSYVPSNADEISQYKIDANGKPIEVKRLNGTATSYVWGYNGEYLLAKIENKNYASIPSNLKSAINSATYSNMPNALNTLRTDLSLRDAMITTFTYDPLIGVTSVTDPKGDVRYYEYDDLGRLEKVEDKQGNIIQELDYNYQH